MYPDEIKWTCFWENWELRNFIMGKYQLIAELLIFKYRWQNISVSNTATCLATSRISQQDKTLRACETVQLLTCETPDVIAPTPWPANSPDLNPVDYQTWGKHRSRMHDVDQLKSRLIEEWEDFHQVFIDEAIRQWRLRLRACIWANGGHSEQTLVVFDDNDTCTDVHLDGHVFAGA